MSNQIEKMKKASLKEMKALFNKKDLTGKDVNEFTWKYMKELGKSYDKAMHYLSVVMSITSTMISIHELQDEKDALGLTKNKLDCMEGMRYHLDMARYIFTSPEAYIEMLNTKNEKNMEKAQEIIKEQSKEEE